MQGAITWETATALLGIVGLIFGVWWRIEGRIKEAVSPVAAKADAAGAHSIVVEKLVAEFRVHAAETFVNKASMVGFRQDTMDRMDRIEDRLDRILERLPAPAPTPPARRNV